MLRFCPKCEREFTDAAIKLCPDDGSKLVFVRQEEDKLIGSTIDNRYEVVERIGEGGMGAVYLARQLPVGREVAIKVLRKELVDDAQAVRRFFHEAKVVSKLRHPNTVTLFDFGQSSDGLLYIAMEFMNGRSLDQLVKERALSIVEILEIGMQICHGLSEAHSLGVIHRDLKPQNIFIDDIANRPVVKVLDFGIAKMQDTGSNLTLTGAVFGTPAYMSPEQAQGQEIDHRSDLYAVGVILFELLCRRLPYPGDSPMKQAMGHIIEPVPDPQEHTLYTPLPTELSELIEALLAKDRDYRPDDADMVSAALESIKARLDREGSAPAVPLDFDSTLDPPDRARTLQTPAPTVLSGDSRLQSSQTRLALRDRKEGREPSLRMAPPEATGPQQIISAPPNKAGRTQTLDEAESVVMRRSAALPLLALVVVLGGGAALALFGGAFSNDDPPPEQSPVSLVPTERGNQTEGSGEHVAALQPQEPPEQEVIVPELPA
ncbi:MAG: serine/threonine protein kinase, partial [Myxococcales bacterium]|nr:serine/threonine protein kinase [Myxococcales bacterium]